MPSEMIPPQAEGTIRRNQLILILLVAALLVVFLLMYKFSGIRLGTSKSAETIKAEQHDQKVQQDLKQLQAMGAAQQTKEIPPAEIQDNLKYMNGVSAAYKLDKKPITPAKVSDGLQQMNAMQQESARY